MEVQKAEGLEFNFTPRENVRRTRIRIYDSGDWCHSVWHHQGKAGEHVYGEVKTRKYSEYNGGTNIRMDEEGKFYLKVYNLKTGESHRFSAEFLCDLEEEMEKTFKAMAEREDDVRAKAEKQPEEGKD